MQKQKNNNVIDLKLDKNRFRVKTCPCGKSNKDGKFVPFVTYENKGYCHSCGLTFFPELSNIDKFRIPATLKQSNAKLKIDFIPVSIFQNVLNNGINLYSKNNFIKWLGNEQRGKSTFKKQTIEYLIETYFLSNSTNIKYKGWMLFPYIDITNRVRDIKAMDYNSSTGKRIKEPYSRCLFLGKLILKNPNANTTRCFYGEHLLKGNKKPVKIFESEATATYVAPFYPESICLATGGNNGNKWTKKDNCEVLRGRMVTLYPDIDAHDDWILKAEILKGYGLNIQVSNLIKSNALKYVETYGINYTELVKRKYDLRDFLKNINLYEFLQKNDLTKINN